MKNLHLKTAIKLAGLMALVLVLAIRCKAQMNSMLWDSIKDPAVLAQLKSFVAAKEAQANAATNKMPAEFKKFFAAADRGDWPAVSNIFENVRDDRYRKGSGWCSPRIPEWRGTQWETVREIWGAFSAFAEGNEKYSTMFGNEVIKSIPPGSIYFGGSDPGRFIVTEMQKSQIRGTPFFTLTQNALTDGAYRDYLHSMYGNEIYIPTADDSQKCINDFYADAEKRYRNGQLRSGEYAGTNSNGSLKVTDEVAALEINGLVAKVIFDKETNRDIYYEEDYPLDWMYPYLEPHGLIFKLNHKQVTQVPDSTVQQDRDYWTKMTAPMIGDWLRDDTSVADVAEFAKKVISNDFNGFKGDRNFVLNFYSSAMISEDRVSIAGFYAWRAEHAADPIEKQRMNREADFAFRQAWALCPASSEAVLCYVQYLTQADRTDDAIIIAKTCAQLVHTNDMMLTLLKNLEQFKKQRDDWNVYLSQVSAMEKEARVHPSNYTNVFSLVTGYMETRQTNLATQLLLQTVSQPNVPVNVLRQAATFFAETDQFYELEKTLKRLTEVESKVPEGWYDLSRLEFMLGKKDEAIKDLAISAQLSDRRLKSDPTALDIRKAARTEKEFDSIRSEPAFQKLITP